MDRTSILIWFGLLFSVTGILLCFSWNSIFDYVVNKDIAVSPTSSSFRTWEKPTLKSNFYMFNWTNAENVSGENYVPEFEELGPYSFKLEYRKVNLTWNANHTVTYKRVRNWYFDPENSKGNLSDQITTLNIVAVASSFNSRFWGFFPTYVLSTGLRMLGQKLWVRTSFREMMFDGYYNPILKIAHTASTLLGTKVQGDRVAWFLSRNGSDSFDGVFNSETGVGDLKKLGILHTWNFENTSHAFEDECSKIMGSTGDLFPPVQSKEEPVDLFVSDICRSLRTVFLEETEVEDIPGYRYEASSSVIDNGTMDPLTECNCAGQCLPVGVVNVSSCFHGLPAFISFPHFYNADPYYLSQLKGLKPDPIRHRFSFVLEPKTGVPLSMTGRLQINVLLQPNKGIDMFKDVPKLMFPVLWTEELVSLEPSKVLGMRLLLLMPVVGPYISLGFAVLGLVMIVLSILPKFLEKYKPKTPLCTEGKLSERLSSQPVLPLICPKGPIPGENGVKHYEESSLLNTQQETWND